MLEELEKYIGKPFKRKGPYGWSLKTMICERISTSIINIVVEQDSEGNFIGEGRNTKIEVITPEGTRYDYTECVFLYSKVSKSKGEFYTLLKEGKNLKK
jgi:hypothetical protein